MPEALSYEVISVTPLSEQVSQVILIPTGHSVLSYSAGRYVRVIGRQTSLLLSVASAPAVDNHLEFHLSHPPENVKATSLLNEAKQQKIWQIQGPFGKCTSVSLIPLKPIIFLARGTGFAPIKAVLESLSLNAFDAAHLYWSVSRQTDFYLLELIEKWKTVFPGFQFTPFVSKEFSAKNAIYNLPQFILQDYVDLSSYQVYASAPRPLIYAALAAFLQRGLHQEWFFSDEF